MKAWNSSTARDQRSVWVLGAASPWTISGAMNIGVPSTLPGAPLTSTLSLSQILISPHSGSSATFPKLMSR
jgi:hypothetical protein